MKYSLGKAYNGDRKEREEEMPKIAVCDDDKESVMRLKEMILSAGISKEIDCYESGEKLVESDQNYDEKSIIQSTRTKIFSLSAFFNA